MLLSDLNQQKFSWGRGHPSPKPPPPWRLATPPVAAATSPSATIILILPPQPEPEHNVPSIKGNIYAWIFDFLKGRTSSVIVNSCHSQSFNLTSSVPQGSILGPLMYIIFANDIAELFTFAKVKMYTNDLTIYALINNENDKNAFQKELDK